VVEVGTPSGWGPAPLTPQQLAEVVEAVRGRAEDLAADVTVLRERTLDSPGGAGEEGWGLGGRGKEGGGVRVAGCGLRALGPGRG
jgi:hypothetical protein